MARISKYLLKGILGALNYKNRNGKQIVSTKVAKGKIKHTENTKRASSTFGMASVLGGELRTSFNASIGNRSEMSMVNRLNGKLISIFSASRDPLTRGYQFDTSSFEPLLGFDFNAKSPLKKTLREETFFHWEEEILSFSCGTDGAPMKLTFPSTSSSCEMIVTVALIRLDAGRRIFTPLRQSVIFEKRNSAPQSVNLAFNVPAGCLFVAGVFLRFFTSMLTHNILVNSKDFSPAAICAIQFTPGTYVKRDGVQWKNMYGLKLDRNL